MGLDRNRDVAPEVNDVIGRQQIAARFGVSRAFAARRLSVLAVGIAAAGRADRALAEDFAEMLRVTACTGRDRRTLVLGIYGENGAAIAQ